MHPAAAAEPFVEAAETGVLVADEEGGGRSLWQDARRRFFQNKVAVASLVWLAIVAAMALIGPLVAPWDYESVDWSVLGNIREAGRPSIESGHWFGTDELGRDLFARTMQGTQISLMVGIVGALAAVVIGTLYGAISGYAGGRVDGFMMRLVDILVSIPYMFVLILLLVVVQASAFLQSIPGIQFIALFVGIGAISWFDMARIARGQTLSLKNREFVEAAIATGVRPFRIVTRHIVPNLMGIVVVYATLLVPNMIIFESFVSFLGLGVQEPATSWGALLNDGAETLTRGTLWQIGFPLFFFVTTLFAFFFIGDGLRDALDPKDR
ncbi:ABC transporter permease subunit [Hasllibacter halocynthiae]